ncbi:MAG: hypothetical protein L6R40_008468 [Gallowayella cf. fulva]|nr:MAG: hypothetical protein L6R40_008468 [Xanthomendoza cf. fulva]
MKRKVIATHNVRVDADVLIPGRGQPIQAASLVACEGLITFVGKKIDLAPQYAALPAIAVPVLMPGMWDSHVHFMGTAGTSVDDMAATPPALAGARSARDIAATLNAGFTSVREMAGYGTSLAKAIAEGWLQGPNIYSSVSILSQTAGHGDAHDMPLALLHDKICHGLPFQLCDGVSECLKAVRMQIRWGAKVIKVAASGGVTSLIDDPKLQQFSDEELEAIVNEATRSERIVAAHCHGKAGIMAALRAGCRTIEHGSYLDHEAIELMLLKNAMLIPTRSIVEFGVQHPEAYSDEIYAKVLKISQAHKESYELAIKAGVRVALGTDLGVSSPVIRYNHGMNGGEFRYAVDAGMTPLQAIEAGTANGPDTLGLQAPKSGQLKLGYDADFIALSDNPLEAIDVLADPDRVTHVWKAGQLVKSPSKPITFFT